VTVTLAPGPADDDESVAAQLGVADLGREAIGGDIDALGLFADLAPKGTMPAVPSRIEIPDNPKKLAQRIAYLVTKASFAYNMLQEGDRVMVCMSGGKDSYALLHFLQHVQRHAPFRFELLAVHLDQGHPGFPLDVLEGYLSQCGSPYEIIHEHTYGVVVDKLKPGKTTCSLCSRLRRGILYSHAQKFGCTKIALGHHRDDILATLMLNLFFCGQLKAMPAKLKSDDGKNVVIRPLAFVPEEMIKRYAAMARWPLIPCSLCSRQPDLKRAQMEALLETMDRIYPGALPSALNAVQSAHPRFLLDRELYDFDAGVELEGRPGAGSDADEDAWS
jgi:tRNA 2-thiocytidine biosynthesis protein TtcA